MITGIVYFSSLLAMCSTHFRYLNAVTSTNTPLILPANFFMFLNFVLLSIICLDNNAWIITPVSIAL